MSVIDIRLSGVMEVRRDGARVRLPGRRVRALLVLLALSAGRTVSVDTLARGIWDDDPPERVRGSLQTYVGRLRQALGSDTIVTAATGYALDVPLGSIDLLRFEQLVGDAAEHSDMDAERSALVDALAVWTGDPFGGAPSEWIERQLVSPWIERYLNALERRVDLDLLIGNHAACVPELRDLIERHPLREPLWVRLLTALDLAGRTAEALQQYEGLRTTLAAELGVDPSPEAQRLYQALLAKEVPGAPLGQHSAPDLAAVPLQLPATVSGFTGRVDQLAALDAILTEPAPRLIALHGPGGVGKTTLAVQWGRRSGDEFPDGQLFVDLQGYGPGEPVAALDALDSLLRGLGVHGSRIPADVEGCSALLRAELADKRLLMVLDNARGAAQVRPLIAGGATVTIVTSRSQLRGLVSREGARRVPVDPMPTDDAVRMLANRLGRGTLDATEDSAALTELADLCGRLPVALAVAAERAGRDGRSRLEAVNERLRSERTRLEALADWEDDPHTDVRAVFEWSYQVLDPDSARMFRLVALHPNRDTAVDGSAALAGTDVRTAERLLDRLTDRHLLTELRPGWYEMHDLTRAYAVELAAGDESSQAVRRMRSWYLHSIRNARYSLKQPRLEYPVPEPEIGIAPAEFASPDQASRWFSAHHQSIRALLAAAHSDGDGATVSVTAPFLNTFLERRGASREAVDLFTMALTCAEAMDDRMVEATCACLLGQSLIRLGDLAGAREHLEPALSLFRQLGHTYGQVAAENGIGHALGGLGRPDEALDAYERALASAGSLPTTEEVLAILNNQASMYLDLGRPQDALESTRRAMTVARESTVDPTVLATTLIALGETLSAVDRWREAASAFDEALELLHRAAHVSAEIVTLKLRGTTHRKLGDNTAARADWQQALDRLDEVGADRVPEASGDELRELLAALF